MGDLIPDQDHVSRYVGKTSFDGDEIDGDAFCPRQIDEYLSVNWLEYFKGVEPETAIQEIREAFERKSRTLNTNAKFVVLNVGKVIRYVQEKSPDKRVLSVLTEPIEPDPSHSGIHNYSHNDMEIGELIADVYNEERISYPARNPTNAE